MDDECVYGCIHPLWGGSGSCTVSDTGDPVCVCDAGYASRDAKGNTSCIPRRVLLAAYLSLATVSLLVAALTVWNISQYRRLPMRIQSMKKTSIRMRALVSTSVYVIGFGSIAIVLAMRADQAGYTDVGVVQIIYILLLPSMVFGIAMIAEYWMECLPSQVFSPGNFAGMLRDASENGNAFVLVGLASGSPISLLGVLTLFFEEEWPQKVADMVVGAVTVGTMGVIVFVAIQTTGVINKALSQGSTSSRAFYIKAKKNLWRQAATLCGISCAVIVVTLIKRLTLIGQYTPSISSTLQILCAHAATAVFASATRFEAPRSADNVTFRADGSCVDGPISSERRGATASIVAGKAKAMQVLLLDKRRRLTSGLAAAPSPGKKAEVSRSGVHDNTSNEENCVISIYVVKPEAGGRSEVKRHPSRNVNTTTVLPTNEEQLSQDDWTVDSVTGFEQDEVPK